MRQLLAGHPLEDNPDEGFPQVYAVGATSWPRCDVETSLGRGYYRPSRHSAGQTIVAGWAYQLVAQIGFRRDLWVAPVDVRRVRPDEDATGMGDEQVKDLPSLRLALESR